MIEKWLTAVGIAAGIWVLGWAIVHFGLEPLRRVFRKSKTHLDDVLLIAVRRYAPVWFLTLGVAVGAYWAPLSPTVMLWLDRVLGAIAVLSVCLALSAFLTGLIERRAAPGLEILPVNSLIQSLIRVILLSLGLLVILGQMGVAITPLLTALGVSSLAVALALQPTLTNLFAGLSILLSHRLRVGDFVEMESGQGGVITDVGWRSTTIEELAGNTFIVPNAKFAEMIVKNYNLPASQQSVPVELRLAPGVDLERAETIAREVARNVQRTVPGAIHDFEPGVVFKSFGDAGIVLAVVLQVRDYRDRGPVTSELIKSLYRRYGETDIELSVAPRHVAVTVTRGAPVAPPGKSPGA